MESWKAQISAVAALDEPTCRQLYDYVIHQPEPVSRDDAAAALELPRTTAAFHLDRLVEEQRAMPRMVMPETPRWRCSKATVSNRARTAAGSRSSTARSTHWHKNPPNLCVG
jgi:hypothetical protein